MESDAAVAVSLAERIRGGDRDAEGELVTLYSRGLRVHLRGMTGDAALADDLHQETFRVVLERLRGDGIADPGRLAGFLLATARNLLRGQARKAVRRGEGQLPENADPPDPVPGPLERTLRREETTVVQRLLGELGTGRDRELLFRFYVAEEDKGSICRDLELSGLHFNRVLFRARQRFKDLLGRQGWDRKAVRGS